MKVPKDFTEFDQVPNNLFRTLTVLLILALIFRLPAFSCLSLAGIMTSKVKSSASFPCGN
ncbi:hypothetical protein AAMO2058_000130100 [Amorphochlora amoebiformis]